MKFESPIGKKNVKQQQVKQYEVEDMSDEEEYIDLAQYDNINIPPELRRQKVLPEPPPEYRNTFASPKKQQAQQKARQMQQEFEKYAEKHSRNQRLLEEQDNEDEMNYVQSGSHSQEERMQTSSLPKRQQKVERMDPRIKKRIELLCGMTRLTREVNIGGTNFTLRSLKSKETRACLLNCVQFAGTFEYPYEFRNQMLSRALTMVADTDIREFLNSNELEDVMELLEELDDGVVARLHEECEILQKEASKAYALNKEDVKEVMEDLKK